MADIKDSLREDFDADAAWNVLANADVAQTAGNERLLKATLAETPPEVALDALIAGYIGTKYEESVRAFAEHANTNPDLMTEIGAVLANNDEDGFLVVAGMAQSGAPADTAQAIADIEQFSKANTENKEGTTLGDIGNFLYTNLVWDSQAPLWMNLAGTAISAVSIGGAIFTGGASLSGLGLRAAIMPAAKLVGGVAAKEVAVGTAAAVVAPPAIVGAANAYVAARDMITGDAAPDNQGTPIYDNMGNVTGYETTPESLEAEASTEEPAITDATPTKSRVEQPIDPVRKGFMNAFNTAASVIEMFVPKQTVGFLAGIAAAFMIATSGDGDGSTDKMQELSGLPELFMEAALGIKPEGTTPPVYTTEPRPSAGAPALVS